MKRERRGYTGLCENIVKLHAGHLQFSAKCGILKIGALSLHANLRERSVMKQ
ncbi:MAG: hypothetical protein IJ055_00595 [Oscillospiraceae bacterium]|nr:hypothetical protein [Oscillospiraceae bacterium]